VERRLAAILAADVAGYSRLMEADEEATAHTLGACREVIGGLVTEHRGRLFASAGGSVVAEFPSPIEAPICLGQGKVATTEQTPSSRSGGDRKPPSRQFLIELRGESSLLQPFRMVLPIGVNTVGQTIQVCG
jgi:class 3 adenylate cyclase